MYKGRAIARYGCQKHSAVSKVNTERFATRYEESDALGNFCGLRWLVRVLSLAGERSALDSKSVSSAAPDLFQHCDRLP